jgi:hypothetical protein
MIGLTAHETELAADGGTLASLITQLDEAKTFLASHEPPVSKYYPTVIGRCAESVAEVEMTAAAMGMPEPFWSPDGTVFSSEKRFGSNVAYRVSFVVKVREINPDSPADENSDERIAVAA